MTTVGSNPASRSTVATREVVVVLPWEPAMAMPSLRRISSPSISARGMTGMAFLRASISSGLSRGHGRAEDDHVGVLHVPCLMDR